MTARSGMTNLITRLRGMTEVGTADYSVNATAYWSDDQLQAILDGQRVEIVREPLRVEGEYASGAWEYHNYYTLRRDIEEDASGTAVFTIRDSLGALHGTAEWTPNYDAGHIRFSGDTAGSAFYLTTRAYDLNAAAADVWQRKAGHYQTAYDFSADGASYKRSQLIEHCLAMAKHYREIGGSVLKVSKFVRTDAN